MVKVLIKFHLLSLFYWNIFVRIFSDTTIVFDFSFAISFNVLNHINFKASGDCDNSKEAVFNI